MKSGISCDSPPLEEGWLRINKNIAKPPLKAQTGWSKSFPTTPSAPVQGCLRRYFLTSRPPLLWRRGIAVHCDFSLLGNTPVSPGRHTQVDQSRRDDRSN